MYMYHPQAHTELNLVKLMFGHHITDHVILGNEDTPIAHGTPHFLLFVDTSIPHGTPHFLLFVDTSIPYGTPHFLLFVDANGALQLFCVL